ncbi:hypothetical protein KJ059_02980 [Myxococcota bacterium]|nr:hypothetical protein [Myxococcota bacterium]
MQVSYDPDRQTLAVEASDDVEVVEGFWFAWMAFHPDSSVWTAPASAPPSPAGP